MRNSPLIFAVAFLLFSCHSPDDFVAEALEQVGDPKAISNEGRESLKYRDKFFQNRAENEEQSLNESIHYFARLHEWSLSYRDGILDLAERISATPGTLDSGLIKDLVKANNDFVQLRYSLYSLLQSNRNYYDRTFQHWTDLHYYKGLCLNLATAVTLYDNMALSMDLLEKHERVKHLFLEGSIDFKITPEYNREVVKSFYSGRRRRLIRQKMEVFAEAFEQAKLVEVDDYLVYLSKIISESPSAGKIQEDSSIRNFSRSAAERVSYRASSLFESHEDVLFSVSKIFGNGMGAFQSRMGYLHDDEQVLREVKQELRPFDILLEKTPFRLTDKFIPGHFGHVAIYIGNERQLKDLGLWDKSYVQPYQEQISQGKVVLEALREGVVLNKLEHFLNVDDFAVIRKAGISDKQSQEYAENAFRQLGKEYDFNFDVETLNKIVCSELVYQVFTDDSWETVETLGRPTISPDAVIKQIEKNSDYKLILFYHQGKRINLDLQDQLVLSLINENNE